MAEGGARWRVAGSVPRIYIATMSVRQSLPADEEAELFEMANLYPSTTGLPMTIWVSPRGGARHDVRIKVCTVHGANMNIGATAIVALRPVPHVVAGDLSAEDFAAVGSWIAVNLAPLIEYWDGAIDTIELAGRLRRVPAT